MKAGTVKLDGQLCASCVPAERWVAWRKAYYLPHAHTLSRLSHPKPQPAKSGRQILLKPSLLLIHACGLPPAHTHCTHTLTLSAGQGVIFPSLPPSLHTYTHSYAQRAQSFNAILYVSLLLTHRTKQVIRAWVESSIHIVLSVCSQSAGLLHSDWTPLAAGRIWAISKKDLLALPADLQPASAYACNSLWHFISSLVTVFIVYYHNINNNDKVIIKSEAI